MFEIAELGHLLSKEAYEKRVPALRTELIKAQEALKTADFPVIVLVSGVDGAGKGDTVNRLNEWLDPRYIRTVAFDKMSDEERERPEFWRYWRSLPPKGLIGLYVGGAWYSQPIAQRVNNESSDTELHNHLARIIRFEKELIDNGALIIKFWLHLSSEAQKQRLKKMESDPATAWRVTNLDKEHLKHYGEFRTIAEHTLRNTDTEQSPWTIVEGTDPRYRDITLSRHILNRIRERLNKTYPDTTTTLSRKHQEQSSYLNLLSHLDLSKSLSKKEYKKKLEKYQCRLGQLARTAREKKISSILVLEGWDASGKGGVIRRIVPGLDARNYQIIPIAAPTDEEHAHHYLWRFWRHIPRAGKITIYDRSWYGRVLVERVEEYASPEEWQRAYAEINDFEQQLTGHGIVLLKFWIHIDKDEQLQRFKAREKVAYKNYKITDEDYRNREKWENYEQAVNDMIGHTSTEYAPWTLIEGNDKRYARIKALRTYSERLEQAVSEYE